MTPLIITGYHINRIWVELLTSLLDFGDLTSPRGQQTRERLAVTLHLKQPLGNIITIPERKLNYAFMVAEWLWIMAGRRDVTGLVFYNKEIAKFSDDGETFFGAYGPMINAQLGHVLSSLSRDHDSRQAVLTIWRPSPPPTKDVPCTVAMQFLIRERALHAIVTMRSSDAWLGIPYDVYTFTRVQAALAAELRRDRELSGLQLGTLTLQLGSSHLYEQHWASALSVVERYSEAAEMRMTMLNQLGRSTELRCGWPDDAWLTAAEVLTRTGMIIAPQFEWSSCWEPYLEVLAWRRHGDLSRGDGYLMRMIRSVRALQEVTRAS
jgi:thymidylate synthase